MGGRERRREPRFRTGPREGQGRRRVRSSGFCARSRFVEHRRHRGDLLVRERRISRASRLANSRVSGSRPAASILTFGSDRSARRGKLVGLVPDDVEVLEHALDQRPGRLAALAALERRQVGAGDAEMRRHVLQEEPALAAQLAGPVRRRASRLARRRGGGAAGHRARPSRHGGARPPRSRAPGCADPAGAASAAPRGAGRRAPRRGRARPRRRPCR